MSIRIVCPSCDKVYNVDDSLHGKKVLCTACREPIAVLAPVRQERREGPASPPRVERTILEVPPPVRQERREDRRPPRDDRIASSRPAGAAGRSRHDEEDEPRRRPPDRYRDRDLDDEPRRGKRPERGREDEEPSGNKSMAPMLIIGGVGVLALLGMIATGLAFAFSGKSSKGNSDPQPVATATEPVSAPAPAGVPAGGAQAPPVEPDKPAAAMPSEMAASVVQQVKHSTVYLRVNMPGGVAQGSGFFAVERGIVITNAHVVGMLRAGTRPPRTVDVVINSGDASEVKTTGTILGVDRDNDLAVLRVAGDLSSLPPPLPLATATKLTETQKVYIFGFPFGAELGKNITVTTSAVSSLRRKDGVLKEVQVNGGMHPGNSGGPVTDTRGAVVGVSVAVIKGTTINFAIPADFIQQVVERAKANPLDPNSPGPGPIARKDPPDRPGLPDGPMPRGGGTMAKDLASLRGVWESGDVNAEGGGAQGTIRLHIAPRAGSLGGRIHIDVIAKQGGRKSTSRLTYSFSLTQKDGNRLLVAVAGGGRRGATGIVFIYTFDGDQLIISGLIKSLRIAYNLRNVSLRRTAANPDMPGADATKGGGTATTGAITFPDDVFSFVQGAVQQNKIADVDIRGFTLGKKEEDKYRDVCTEGGVLIGMQVGLGKFVNNVVLQSWRPIYRTKTGEKFGQWHGPAAAAPTTVKAKDGYVVSGMMIRSGLAIDGFTLTFAKLGKNRIDLTDTYQSMHVGGTGGAAARIGGRGELFVGLVSHRNGDKAPSTLGLVAVRPKE